jgi:hypothetical protein
MAAYEEFNIDQGADLAVELHLINADGSTKDLTNHSVAAKLKKNYNSDSDETTDFNAIIATPPTDGIITLSLTNTQTDALSKGRYVFDVEISFVDSDDNTIIERVLEGRAQVAPSVTR